MPTRKMFHSLSPRFMRSPFASFVRQLRILAASHPVRRSMAMVAGVLLGLIATSGAHAYDALPLPAKPGQSRTFADMMTIKARFDRATMVTAYRDHGRRQAEWDGRAERYLQEMVKRYADAPDALSYDMLGKFGQELIQLGCDDPMVLYCHARTLMGFGDFARAEPFMLQSVDGLQGTGYPVCRAYFAAIRQATLYGNLKRQKERDAAIELADLLLVKTIKKDPMLSEEQWVIYFHIHSSLMQMPYERVSAIAASLEATPVGGNDYLEFLVLGDCHLRRAAQILQNDKPNNLTLTDFTAFSQEIATARGHYSKAWALYDLAPDAAIGMLTCARLAGPDRNQSTRMWFDRAVGVQFDAVDAYDEYLATLLPSRGGSARDVYDFGQECLRTQRFDTLVPYTFVKALLALAADPQGQGYDSWMRLPDAWPQVRDALTAYTTSPTFREDAAWYYSLSIAFAWRFGQFADAAQRLQDIGGNFMPAAFSELRVPTSQALVDILARTGPQAAATSRIESLYGEGRLSEALTALNELDTIAVDRETRTWTARRKTALDLESKLATPNTWIPLTFADSLSSWSWEAGGWTAGADGTAVTATGAPEPRMLHAMRAGNRIEMEATIAIPPEATNTVAAGLRLGITDRYGAPRSIDVRIAAQPYPHLEIVELDRPPLVLPLAKAGSCVLRALLWDQTLSVWVDDQPMLVQYRTNNRPENRFKQVGLCAALTAPTETVTFSNVRVRTPNLPPTSGISINRELDSVYFNTRIGEFAKAATHLTGIDKGAFAADDPARLAFVRKGLAVRAAMQPDQPLDMLAQFSNPGDWQTVGSGTWTIKDGELICTAGAGVNYFISPLFGDNLSYRAEFDLPDDTIASIALVLNWQPQDQPITVMLHPDAHTWGLGRGGLPVRTFTGSEMGGKVKVEVLAVGKTINVLVNGRRILSRIFETAPQGHLGVGVIVDQPGAVVHFTRISATAQGPNADKAGTAKPGASTKP